MYRKYLKRWLDFVIVLCVLAVIWPILLLITLWLHFANKERVPSLLRNVPDEMEKYSR